MKAGLAAAYLLALTSAMGQYGASPSTTSLFFDDLRARSKQSEMDSNSGVRDGAVTYDYERGAYVGTEEERLMGEHPVTRKAQYGLLAEVDRLGQGHRLSR